MDTIAIKRIEAHIGIPIAVLNSNAGIYRTTPTVISGKRINLVEDYINHNALPRYSDTRITNRIEAMVLIFVLNRLEK